MADEGCVSLSFILHLQLLHFRGTSALSILAGVEVTGTGPSRSTREGHSGRDLGFLPRTVPILMQS